MTELSENATVLAYAGPIAYAGISLLELPGRNKPFKITVELPESFDGRSLNVRLIHYWSDGF